MDPDETALFRELADRSPSEREEYCSRHKVPAALRAEVESLLRFDGATADSLHAHVAAAAQRVLIGDLRAAPPQPMALAQGTKLGPYEITAFIGAGGMGRSIVGTTPDSAGTWRSKFSDMHSRAMQTGSGVSSRKRGRQLL